MKKDIPTKGGATPIVLVTYVCSDGSQLSPLSSILGVDLESVKIERSEGASKDINPIPGKRYVYGIRGIQDLFNVSHVTAQKYKDGILRDAIYQSGRKIVVDVEKAMELFNSKGGR